MCPEHNTWKDLLLQILVLPVKSKLADLVELLNTIAYFFLNT